MYFWRVRKSSFLKKSLQWASLIQNKRYLGIWIVSLITTLTVLVIVGLYLCYNESRVSGIVLDDFVLDRILPRDVSTILFSITWICILGGLPILLRTPERAMRVFWGISVMGLTRCIVMWFLSSRQLALFLWGTLSSKGCFTTTRCLLRIYFSLDTPLIWCC